MTDEEPLPSWPRPYFQPGGGDAHLFYKIHGVFTKPPAISRARHRCGGVPEGCSVEAFSRSTHPSVLEMGLGDDWIGQELRRTSPAMADAVAGTEQCLVLHGDIADPPTLDYFRDAVGLLMALLENGGLAVFDPHVFRWWSPEEWRRDVFDPAGAVPRRHALILVSDEPEPGRKWYHTRGMRKYGRPDLSVHGVTTDLQAGVQDLLNRLIQMQALGGVVPEGQPIELATLPGGWCCSHRGSNDDPEFNNRHLEIGPAPQA